MAEGILRTMIEQKGLEDFYVSSAGIITANGLTASTNAIIAASGLEADISMHRSRQLTVAMLEAADCVWCMTQGQADFIGNTFSVNTDKVSVLGDEDVEDPFGADLEQYQSCATDIMFMLENRLEDI